MSSKYKLLPMPKSYCPNCHALVHWLHQPDNVVSKPSFFICFACQFVGQTGVGPVEAIDLVEAPSDFLHWDREGG